MRRAVIPLLCLGCLIVLVGTCFRSVLFADGQFGYRDAAHFYYPLYLRVQQEWNAGRIPLWEPEENGGIPLIGNPTAAVLYPGKVIYGVLPYAWAARVYVVAHVVLAFAAMIVLARSWGISGVGATLAAASYAFGAPVLFQYTNVIYLVGAAWMPLGFHAVDRWVRRHDRGAIPQLGAVLAMQILGGDPQAAYLVLLCGAGYAGCLACVRASAPPRVARVVQMLLGLVLGWSVVVLGVARSYPSLSEIVAEAPIWLPSFSNVCALVLVCTALMVLWVGRRRNDVSALRAMLIGLAGSSALAAGLTAAHLIPTIEYSRQSFRALDRSPVEIYPFSLEPYRILEFAWPEVYGSAAPENRYWLPTIEPLQNHQFWSPSLYVGGLTLVLAFAAAGLRSWGASSPYVRADGAAAQPHRAHSGQSGAGGEPWRVWLTVVAIVSLLASLGRYGSPLWLARWVPSIAAVLGPHDPPFVGPFRPDGQALDGDGGLYWLMAVALPGFGTFRFPSKLLTLTALALAALAGMGWDQVVSRRSRRVAGLGVCLLAASALALAATFVWRDALLEVWKSRGILNGSSHGPFIPEGALIELRRALAHGAIVAVFTAWIGTRGFRRPRLTTALALACLTADLAIANGRLVWTIPQRELERTPEAIRQIGEAERANPSAGPFRVHRMPHWFPLNWSRNGSAGRLLEMAAWERDTLQPLYALPYKLNYTMTKGALELYDFLWFFRPRMVPASGQVADLLGVRADQPVLYYPRRGFDLWGTRYYILPVRSDGWTDENRAYAAFLGEVEMVYPKLDAFEGAAGKANLADWRSRWQATHDWQLFRSKTAYPRAWIVHDARFFKPITGLDPADRERPMRLLLFQNDSFWHDPDLSIMDTRTTALIETDRREDLALFVPGTAPHENESVKVVHHSPQRVELDATLERPGLVILADVYYPGWRLRIDNVASTVLRANRMMRGAAVRAGRHRLVYVYDPPSFRIGVGISVGSLAVLAGLVLWTVRGAPRPGTPTRDPV